MGGAGASANSGNNRPKWMQPPSREQQRRTQRRNRIIMFVVVAAIFIYLIIDSANWGKQAEQFEQPQDYVSASAPSGEALSAAKNLRETEPTNGVGYRRRTSDSPTMVGRIWTVTIAMSAMKSWRATSREPPSGKAGRIRRIAW